MEHTDKLNIAIPNPSKGEAVKDGSPDDGSDAVGTDGSDVVLSAPTGSGPVKDRVRDGERAAGSADGSDAVLSKADRRGGGLRRFARE